MEKKEEIAAGAPERIAGVTIIPIIETATGSWRHRRDFSAHGLKRPVGVIIVSSLSAKSFDSDGREVPLEDYIKKVPEHETILKNTL